MRVAGSTLAAVLAVAVAAGLFTQSGSADSSFSYTTTVKVCNAMPASFSDPTFGGNPLCVDLTTPAGPTDTTVTYSAPPNNVNLHRLVTFFPGSMTMPGGGFGSRVAGVRMLATTGTLNGPCNTGSGADFVLYKVDPASTPSYPQAAGSVNRFGDWRVGSTAVPGDGGVVGGVDASHAGAASRPLTNVPQYVLDEFAPAVPTAIYGGLTAQAGEWTPLYLAQFAPGGLSTAPGAYSRMNSDMGQPVVLLIGDPTTSQRSPSATTQTCDTSSITMTLLSTVNPPSAGTAFFMQYAASERDTDQDGFENAIDTCPLNANPAENPRSAAGDTDTDGIKDSCDSNGPYSGSSCIVNGGATCSDDDVDDDGFQNTQDNCPQVVNAGAAQADASEVSVPADLGPRFDYMGDACDSGTLTITQNGHSVTVGVGGVLSPSVANGRYHARTTVAPRCFGGTDADGDGYCAGPSDNADSGMCTTTTPNSCYVRHSLWLNTPSPHPALQMDTDGDSVAPSYGQTVIAISTDAVETYLGTDVTKPCAQTKSITDPPPNTNDEGPLDNWPLDFDDNGIVNVGDYLKYNIVLSSAAGGFRAVNMGGNGDGTATSPATMTHPAFGSLPVSQNRFDVNMDGYLNSAELGKFNGYMNLRCGWAGTPPTTVNNSGTFQQ